AGRRAVRRKPGVRPGARHDQSVPGHRIARARAHDRPHRTTVGAVRGDCRRPRRRRPRRVVRHVPVRGVRPPPASVGVAAGPERCRPVCAPFRRETAMVSDDQPPVIELEDLCKIFYTDEVETHALSEITLSIQRGEYVSVAGPSGCGKSTLLSILGLLDTPTSGRYRLNGRQGEDLSMAERARVRNREIGFIFQSFNLIGDLTVYEDVELPLTYRGMPASERKDRVLAALERVEMLHRARHLPAQLSGGQQQRVAVARAVAGSPSILLADEPTGNLDSKNGESVMNLMT